MNYEFAKTDVNLDLLTEEIQEVFPGASCTLRDTLLVHTTDALTNEQQQQLETVVSNHVNKEPLKVKIYDYVSESGSNNYDVHQPPKGLNYKSGLLARLYPVRTTVKGEVIKVDYFGDSDLTDHVLEVTISYNRDPLGFAIDRTVTRKWVLEDGSFHPDFKITHKFYTHNPEDQIKEGIRRRGNIIDFLQPRVLSFMIETMGISQNEVILAARDFMNFHKESFERFIRSSSSINDDQDPNYGRKEIVVDIENDTTAWLDNKPTALGGATIRQYIIGELNI